MSNGFVYLIESFYEGNTTYKIGKTNRKINKRLKEINTLNPSQLKVLFIFESKNYGVLEKTLHRIYESKKINGEWFKDIELNDFQKHFILYG
jgi:hypothetical protein